MRYRRGKRLDGNHLRRFIELACGRQLSLAIVARRFRCSKFSVRYALRRDTGRTFSDILNQARMKEARRLLRDTKWTVDRVARSCGYRERSGLERAFKAYHRGIRPCDYRRDHWGQVRFVSLSKLGRKRRRKGLHKRHRGPYLGRWTRTGRSGGV